MESITIRLQDDSNAIETIEIPLGISMSLMEVLKGEGKPIEATCGGMALCATCHIEVLNNDQMALDSMGDDEAFMLESLPFSTDRSRLSCQLKIAENLDGLLFRLAEVAV